MSNKANNKSKDIFAVNEFKAVPSSMFKATRMQYVSADGEIVEIQISSDFKMIYSYLYDQQRSFAAQKGVDGEPQEMYQDWEYIFSFIGRKYKGDKNSMKIVKDLEATGLLIQTKRPNSTSTVKTVLDVTTIPTIKFSNAKHAEYVNGQPARRQARQEQYAAAKKAKLAAIEEVKNQIGEVFQTFTPVWIEAYSLMIGKKCQLKDFFKAIEQGLYVKDILPFVAKVVKEKYTG